MIDLEQRAVRYVDDILIGLAEVEAGPNILSPISSALYEYELELNAEKTKIIGIGANHRPEWMHFVKTFQLSSRESRQRADLDSYFEQVFYLADSNPRESVLLFSTKRACSFDIAPSNVAHLTRLLLYSARRSATCLSFVAEHLASLHKKSMKLPTTEIHNYILQQLKIKSGFAHTDEIAWLLFWAREIGLKIPSEALEPLSALRSSVIALLTLDLNQRGLVAGKLKSSFWKSFATVNGLKSGMWLVSYEATKKGWWRKPQNPSFITGHPFFSDIWAKDVEFYDLKKFARTVVVSPFQKDESPERSMNFSSAGYPF